MHIKEIHYNIKKKLNKVDSQQYRNLLIPEIDIAINEAMDIFIKLVAFPRYATQLGFEKTQRSIDDIRTVVNSEHNPDNQFIVVDNQVALPQDYMFYISSHVQVTKGECASVNIDTTIVQHDDKPESSVNYRSNFEWRIINAEFNSDGIRFYNDGSFEINKFCLSYIKKPKYAHNAEDFTAEGYTLPSGTTLTGFENCELPDQTHADIIDIAVMLLSGEMNNPGHEFTMAKLKLNQLN
jgi:hypothetical protein